MGNAPRTVTAVRKHPARDEYSIYIDGEHAVDLDAETFARLCLVEGDTLDDERLEALRGEAALGRAKARALKLLTVKSRTEAEMERRLKELGYDDAVVAPVIAWLRSLWYRDDEAFAVEWVRARGPGKRLGARRLALELRRKGVAGPVAERAARGVTQADEEAWAFELAAKKLSSMGELPREKTMRRIYGLLERRGFGREVIARVLSRLFG